MSAADTTARLEYLRRELRAERISYGELAELQGLVPHIAPGDVELLEAAGVPEFEDTRRCYCPDDCNCHYPWRTNFCGCKGHDTPEPDADYCPACAAENAGEVV